MNNGSNDCQRISRRVALSGAAAALGAATISTAVSRRQRNRRSARRTLHIRARQKAISTATAAPISNRRTRANLFKATSARAAGASCLPRKASPSSPGHFQRQLWPWMQSAGETIERAAQPADFRPAAVVASPRRADLKAVDDQIRRYDLPLCHLFTLDKLWGGAARTPCSANVSIMRFMRPETFASSMNSLMYASHLSCPLGMATAE